jgi:hypothetical protein
MKTRQYLQIFFIFILMLASFGFTPSTQGFEAAKAQPVLVEMALQEPGLMVRVIVQKMAGVTASHRTGRHDNSRPAHH